MFLAVISISSLIAKAGVGTFECVNPPVSEARVMGVYNNWFQRTQDAKAIVEKYDTEYPKTSVSDFGLDLDMAALEGYSFNSDELSKFNLVEGLGMIDDSSHGTGIVLQIGAKKNDFGMIGIIPGIDITPIRIMQNIDSNFVPLEKLAKIFKLLKENDIKIMNMSWGADEKEMWSKPEVDALFEQYKDDFLVVAAIASGKAEGVEMSYDSPECIYFPTCINSNNVIKVGSLASNGVDRAKRSNQFIGEVVDIWEVGDFITQWRWSADSTNTNRKYELKYGFRGSRGTSGAAPIVTAVAAMVFKANPGLKPSQVKEILINTSDSGRLNPVRAVEYARQERF